MKRRELIRELIRKGCVLDRHGGSHDIYLNPAKGQKVSVPRHNEIQDNLCKLIRKQLGLT